MLGDAIGFRSTLEPTIERLGYELVYVTKNYILFNPGSKINKPLMPNNLGSKNNAK